jgi:hypothetical protein
VWVVVLSRVVVLVPSPKFHMNFASLSLEMMLFCASKTKESPVAAFIGDIDEGMFVADEIGVLVGAVGLDPNVDDGVGDKVGGGEVGDSVGEVEGVSLSATWWLEVIV